MPKTATASHPMMHKTRIDIPQEHREDLVSLLNERLSETIDLQLQIKQAHWNVKGPSFIGLHELFDSFYTGVIDYVDLTAERITALGGVAEGTVQAVTGRSELPSYPLRISEGLAHVDALATSFAAFGKATRAAIERADDLGDADTADLFTEISRGIDKDLWFLEAHLQAPR